MYSVAEKHDMLTSSLKIWIIPHITKRWEMLMPISVDHCLGA
jgi:hypothetical protein